MVAVSPTPSDIPLAQRPARTRFRVLRAIGRWVRLVAGRLPGQFTIAKLHSFDHFRSHATPSWVLIILLASPLPCLIVNLLIESTPLSDPATGLRGSVHFQIRNFVTATIMTMMPVFTKVNYIPELSTRAWKFVVGYGLTVAAVAIATNAAISVLANVFPLPFTQFAPTVPMALVAGLLNRCFLHQPGIEERSKKIDQRLALDSAPIFVYPLFTAVFMAVKPSQQLWLSLLLPIIKRLIRHVIWLVFRDDRDIVGAATCSISHLYHVLFTAMCLQNAKSLETLTAVVLINMLNMLLNCRDIMKDAASLQRSKNELFLSSISIGNDLVSAALGFAEQEHVSKALHRKSPSQFFSEYPGYQQVDFVAKHRRLLQMDQVCGGLSARLLRIRQSEMTEVNSRQVSKHRSLLSAKSLSKQTTPPIQQGFAQIVPLSSPIHISAKVPSTKAATRFQTMHSIDLRGSQAQSERYVGHVTWALHQSETILLRSYISIFVLAFYGIYLTVVFWLPNRRYFATMVNLPSFESIDIMIYNLLLLGSMEMTFMATYLTLISRRLGVSGIHQLAFVLWSQRVLLQSKFLALTLMILGFPLEHYGNGIIYRLKTE